MKTAYRPSFFFIAVMTSLFAQTINQSDKAKAFPDARFYMEFRKHLNPNAAAGQFFAWEGRAGGDFAGFRKGKQSAEFKIDFQTVGGKMLNQRVEVVGTSYILEGRYGYVLRKDMKFETGITHLSAHRGEDLDRLVLDALKHHRSVPVVVNAEDLNVVFAASKT